MIRKRVSIVSFGVLFLAVFVFGFVPVASAQVTPFGGPILSVFPCNTPLPAVLMYLGPPLAVPVMFFPGSALFEYFALHPGALLLGVGPPPPPAPCIFCAPLCVTFGSGIPIIMTGTSF